uniref:Uncharacterized protein n=1 Tax=Tanacetum cinerariifolium TaxID=118510 RepID=A0A6L2JMA1_TANCI|nr:hypothetical protein [Tanacetum cinerariifolium]
MSFGTKRRGNGRVHGKNAQRRRWRRRQNLLLTSSGSYGDDVTTGVKETLGRFDGLTASQGLGDTNANPSSPKSPNSFMNMKIQKFQTLLKSLNLAALPIERELSCLERDVGFVELFKLYEVESDSEEEVDEETEEEEEVVEGEELCVEYFDKFPY